MPEKSSRRLALKNMLAGSLVLGSSSLYGCNNLVDPKKNVLTLKGNINHSVCRWCFNDLTVEELCEQIKKIGFTAIDLAGPADWPVLQAHGIYSSMCNGAEINLTDGFAGREFHPVLIKNYLEMIPRVAEAGYKNLICFSGNRRGMSDESGWENAAEGIRQIISTAEKHGIILHMELLNSRIDHEDYMCDKTYWGVELCKRVNSSHFKLLYDIYHMQIDEGDVIRTIRNNHSYIGHYHTAGVPGRHEPDLSQELYYPAIVKAIAETGFKGYIAQEFIPSAEKKEDKLKALKEAINICDI